MTPDRITEIIKEYLEDRIRDRETGKVVFEVNYSQGGIGDCKIKTENKMS